MFKVIAHRNSDISNLTYRTEDIRFSPSGLRLAVAATDGCILLYSIDITTRPITVDFEVEIRSPSISVPHGVEFLNDNILVVANRNGKLAFFRIPPSTDWGSPCVLSPLVEVTSPLFGASGEMRDLRGRGLFCGPGSVRYLDGVLFVSCNRFNTVSTFRCHLDQETVTIEPGVTIAQDGLEVIDGIALSRTGALLALSDHDHHRVVVYRRLVGAPDTSRERPCYVPVCRLTDEDMHYAHGLQFDLEGRRLYVADAGGRYLHVFETVDGWQSDIAASSFKTEGVDQQAFDKSREPVPEEHRPLEGGAKGLDISPGGAILAATCRNQILRFFEIEPVHNTAPLPGIAYCSGSPRSEESIVLSCVLDDVPSIWNSIIPWLATATTLAGVDADRLHIHHVCALPSRLSRLFRELGVQTHEIKPFSGRHPHANKIMQCATSFGTNRTTVVLTDADIVFTGKPPFNELSGLVAGKLVDKPNPPLSILNKIFAAANVAIPGICTGQFRKATTGISFETYIGNFNGGLYSLPRSELARLGRRWVYWAYWLNDHISLMDQWSIHLDQVAFCLAVSELRLPLRMLDNRWNFPAHIDLPPLLAEPWIVHHHALFDDRLQLMPVADPMAQASIDRVNRVVASFIDEHELSTTFAFADLL